MMLSTCATCGDLTEGTYCAQHRPKDNRGKNRRHAGYDAAWDRLSARARRLQPFCSACGATTDLTGEHTPQAWERKAAGKPIRLQDIDVLCRSCNSKAGAARGEKIRSKTLLTTRGGNPKSVVRVAPGRVSKSITFNQDLKVSGGGVVNGGA